MNKKIKNKFPWLLSNLYTLGDKTKPLPPGIEYHILDVNGIKVNCEMIN